MLKFGLILVLVSWFYLFGIEAYVEMDLREGRPLFYNDTTFADMTRLRVKKINRTTHVFLGNATSFVDIGNDYTIEANCYKKQGNEYRKTPYNFQKVKFCDFFVHEKFFYDHLLTVSNLPAKGVCPWPKGDYYVTGNVFQMSVVPPFFEGDFMLEGVIKKGNVAVNGYQIYVNVVRVN